MRLRLRLDLRLFVFASVLASRVCAPAVARADEPPPARDAMPSAVHDYYAAEVKTSFLFMGYGAVTAGAGALTLQEEGDFARGFGWSSVALGSATALGGSAYGIAAALRGDYYERLAKSDPTRFKAEESERIAGTNSRFWMYLGSELLETAAGIGIAAYGMATNDDLLRGIGTGTALQGIGLFVIDVPGAGRASRYQDEVRAFQPSMAFDGRSFMASARHSF